MYKLTGQLPSKAIIQPIATADKFILSKRNVEIPSHINGNYSYTGNSRIEFDINSPADFIDFANSYFRCDLTTDLSLEGADCASRYLSEGGINSLFREVRLESQAGVLIDRVQRYNKWYAMMSSILHPKDYVDANLQASGDSTAIEATGQNLSSFKIATGSSFVYDDTAGASEQLITGTASSFLNEVRVGDIVVFVDNDGASYTGVVSVLTTATTMNVNGLGTTDFTANSMYIVRKDEGVEPARQRIANTDSSVVSTKLMLPFMSDMESYFPLFLVRSGLRLIIELERPEFVLAAPQAVISAGYTGASYTISNANYVASFVKPSEALAQQFVQMYKQSGLSFHHVAYEHRMNVISAGNTGTQNLRLQVNGRSARHILGFMQDVRGETVTAAATEAGQSTFTCDSVSQRIKGGLTEYQVEIGSERFPQSSPLDVSSVDNSEVLVELEKTLGIFGLPVPHRWNPNEWIDVAVPYKEYEQGRTSGRAQATRLILPANFARDSSPWCGVDATLHSINVMPNIGSAYALTDMDGSSNSANSALYFHSFVGLDRVVMLSESSGLTVLS